MKNSQIFVKHLLQWLVNQRSQTLKASIKDFAWSKDGKYFSFSAFNEYDKSLGN